MNINSTEKIVIHFFDRVLYKFRATAENIGDERLISEEAISASFHCRIYLMNVR